MTFDLALRLTEILLGLALLQQSLEHLASAGPDRNLFLVRTVISIFLVLGIGSSWMALALLAIGMIVLRRFDGPYNGGSDRMSLLILICLCLAHFLPTAYWREVAFGYLAAQLVLSYFLSGAVKIINPDWRTGTALRDVFLFSTYPVSEETRQWADRPRLLFVMSWAVMVFELLFPLTLLSQQLLVLGLITAALFHLANAYLFGLNRFVWSWLAAYPSILWLQQLIAANLLG